MSLALLKHTGATSIEPNEEARLLKRWKASSLWPSIAEQEPGVYMVGHERRFSYLTHFCPEVTFDRFGFFATFLDRWLDEVDRENAHEVLASQGVPRDHWRWHSSALTPQHYSECPTYSVLAAGKGIDTPASDPPNVVEAAFRRLRQHRIVAFLVVIGVITVALGAFTEALAHIWHGLDAFFRRFVG